MKSRLRSGGGEPSKRDVYSVKTTANHRRDGENAKK